MRSILLLIICSLVTSLFAFSVVSQVEATGVYDNRPEADARAALCGGSVRQVTTNRFEVINCNTNPAVSAPGGTTTAPALTRPPAEESRRDNYYGRSVTIANPLGPNATIQSFLFDLIDVLLVFAMPIIIFFIIYAGFLYVVARGEPAQITKANNTLLYAVIGGLLILGARVIFDVIEGTVDALTVF